MKTNLQLQSWLRRTAVLLIVLTGSLPIVAQEGNIEGGEAFYIYQNDGHFDGFFYDQVKQIRYSRLDTLGIEHDRYVSQEIVTEDSVYRIMLTAIDSVSYVQPEIKFAKEVRFMRDEGMMAYYKSISRPNEDSFQLRFSGSMPTALQPKVGDVLSCPNLPDYEESFVGKVKKVRQESGETVVECGYVEEFSDVFEQFITVEQVRNIQTPEGNKTRHRVAGWKATTRVEGNIDEFTLFYLNTGFEFSTDLYDNLKFVAGFDVNFGVNLSSVYNISIFTPSYYFKHDLKAQFGLGASISLDGELYNNELGGLLSKVPGVDRLTKISLPVTFPLFNIEVTPKPLLAVEAHLKASFSTGFKFMAMGARLESRETFPYMYLSIYPAAPFIKIPEDLAAKKEWSINAQLNGSVQAGLTFPIVLRSENWFSKLMGIKTGIDVNVGPKLSGALDLTLLTNNEDEGYFSTAWPKGTYDRLKGTKVDVSLLSIDPQISAEGTFLKKEWEVKRTTNFSFGNFSLNLFPNIGNLECELTGKKKNTIKCHYDVSGEVFWPQTLGVILYMKKDKNDKDFSVYMGKTMRDETYFFNTFNSVDVNIKDLLPGTYKVSPVVMLPSPPTPIFLLPLPMPVIVESKEQVVIVTAPELMLDPEIITAEEDGGEFDIDLLTALDNPISYNINEPWIDANIVTVGSDGEKQLKLKVSSNETEKYRIGKVSVYQVNADGENVEKILTVNQFGGLELSQSKLEFTKEGGEQTIDILTSYQPITIALGDASTWLRYSLDDRKFTIKADPNKGGNRTAIILISAFSKKKNRNVEVKLTITQKGLVDANIEPTELNFDVNGGTQSVYVAVGNDTEFTDVSVRDKSDTWVTVEKMTSVFNVTVKPNEDEKRTAYVDATFTAKDKDGKTYTVTLPVTISQKGIVQASVMPSELIFDSEGGDREAAITKGDYSYCGAWVEDSAKDWLSVTVKDKGENAALFATAIENMSREKRTGEITVYFSTVPNPQEEDMTKVTIKVTQKGKAEMKILSVNLFVDVELFDGRDFIHWSKIWHGWSNNNKQEIWGGVGNGAADVHCSDADDGTLTFMIAGTDKLKEGGSEIKGINGSGDGWSLVTNGSKGNDYKEDENSITCTWDIGDIISLYKNIPEVRIPSEESHEEDTKVDDPDDDSDDDSDDDDSDDGDSDDDDSDEDDSDEDDKPKEPERPKRVYDVAGSIVVTFSK